MTVRPCFICGTDTEHVAVQDDEPFFQCVRCGCLWCDKHPRDMPAYIIGALTNLSSSGD